MHEGDYEAWLHPKNERTEELKALLRRYGARE